MPKLLKEPHGVVQKIYQKTLPKYRTKVIATKFLDVAVLFDESEYIQKKHCWQLFGRQICQGIGTQQHKLLAHQGYSCLK
jgi:hypothetical protein